MKLINKHMTPTSSLAFDNTIDVEFQQFLSRSQGSSSMDVCAFWEANAYSLPKLAKLVQVIHGICPTSVLPERAFSIAGIVINKQTSSLHHVTAHRKIFVHDHHDLFWIIILKFSCWVIWFIWFFSCFSCSLLLKIKEYFFRFHLSVLYKFNLSVLEEKFSDV